MAKYSYHRLDANHPEIRQALEQVGATVEPIGPLDLLVGFQGSNYIMEIKTATGKLRPKQTKFLAGWRGSAHVVRTREEALKVIGVF